MRTHYCGQVNEQLVGQTVSVAGWVHRRRDHGGVIFVDLRDREGLVQIVLRPGRAEVFATAEKLRSEFVVRVTGRCARGRRARSMPGSPPAGVEMLAAELELLNRSDPLPFQLDETVNEELRLSYRYLDLRRELMTERLRAAPSHHARDAALPGRARLHRHRDADARPRRHRRARATTWCPAARTPGKFFALPQSPQIFKQLLMMAGFDRYYQIVRCFRDEDLRADRQPEFTQLDVETSFLDAGADHAADGGPGARAVPRGAGSSCPSRFRA